MYRTIRLAYIPAVLALGACSVQVNDTTPAEFQANNDIGMYKVSATAADGALVTPNSLLLNTSNRWAAVISTSMNC